MKAPAKKPAVKRTKAKSCRVNRFLPGTLVLMADGSSRPIEEVEVGDLVWATDPETGESSAEPVTDLILGDGMKDLVRIGTDADSDGVIEWVTATDGHPFWVDGGGWTDAGDLAVGDVLVSEAGSAVEVAGVAVDTRSAVVHNLTVNRLHTSWDDWTSSDGGWDEMAAEIARWNVIWAPEHLNDRVLFRAFSFPEAGLDPDWVVRQRAVRASVETLTPVVPGTNDVRVPLTNDVRVPLTSEYLHAMIMRVVSDHEFAAPQEGLSRLNGRERRQLREGQLSQLRDVFNLLWEAGHALTVVPLGACLTVATIDDPWLPFMDSASS